MAVRNSIGGVICAAFVFAAGGQAQTPAGEKSAAQLIGEFNDKVTRGDAIVAEIGAMYARDQHLQAAIIAGFKEIKSEEVRQAYIEGTRAVFDRVDGANTKRLIEILETISWAELTALSPSAADDAWSIVSHSSDNDFKRKMLAVFEPLALNGKMSGSNYAMLYDDLAVSEGRPQRYATNFDCIDGKQQPKPTEDMAGLNSRRVALGMQSIEEYTSIIVEMYGECPKQ